MSADGGKLSPTLVRARDYGPAIDVDLAPASSSLYFFFGGISGNLAMPPFEFYKASGVLDCKKVFIRDLSQSWYHGDGKEHRTVPQMLEVVREIVDEAAPEKLTFVGNSMGGFAAILFACLLGRGRALAFAPQTFCSPGLKLGHGDLRWKHQTVRIWCRGFLGERFWNLAPLVRKAPDDVSIDIYVPEDDKLDMIHADHLKGDPKVKLHLEQQGGHRLVSSLRDQGRLAEILQG